MVLCREIEIEAQTQMKAENRRFVGLRKLAKTHWWRRAKSPEKRFCTIPTVASSQARTRKEELRKNEAWRRDYAAQRANFRRGAPTKLPAGSYFLPTIYNADVEPP